MGHARVALLELHLLLQRQGHRLSPHLKHGVYLCVNAVVLQAECGVSVWAAAELTAAS